MIIHPGRREVPTARTIHHPGFTPNITMRTKRSRLWPTLCILVVAGILITLGLFAAGIL